jgi:CTP-dependent riboflavin kinase
MKVVGEIVHGIGHFRQRMTKYEAVFTEAVGHRLEPGTLNVRIDRMLRCQEHFRIRGCLIGEPEQDLLFERCVVAGQPAYRIRPIQLSDGLGGHGDNVLEIASEVRLRDLFRDNKVEIEFPHRTE